MRIVADTVQPITASTEVIGHAAHLISHAWRREGKEMFLQVSTGAWNTLTEGFPPPPLCSPLCLTCSVDGAI